MRKRGSDSELGSSISKPAETSAGREAQMVSLAEELAEKQLREGTASAQVISHYLKLGSSRERLEQQRIDYENQLMQVKIDSVAQATEVEELYKNAINAMRSYTGQEVASSGYD